MASVADCPRGVAGQGGGRRGIYPLDGFGFFAFLPAWAPPGPGRQRPLWGRPPLACRPRLSGPGVYPCRCSRPLQDFAKSNNKINNNSISRERKTIQKKGNNCYQQSNNIDNSNNNISNNNISEDGESDEGASKGGCDIDCYPVNNNIHSRCNCNNNNESYDNNDSEINNFNFTDFDFSFMDNCFKYCKKNLHLSKEDLWTC